MEDSIIAQLDAVGETEVDVSSISSDRRLTIMKKLLGDGDDSDVQRSNLVELSDEMTAMFNRAGAIEPPLDPLQLVRLVSKSGTAGSLISAMAVNVHGFGYRFEPLLDLDSADSWERIKTAMVIEAEQKAEEDVVEGEEPDSINEPSDEEVDARIESLKAQMRKEKAKLYAFFENCGGKFSFTRLSRRSQVDKETTGYSAIEVRRDGKGQVSRLTYAPSWTFRAMPMTDPVDVNVREKATEISWRTVKESLRFRRYVQIYETEQTFFKEFGDRRVMSCKTGLYYENLEALKLKEPTAAPATEILWFALDSSESDIYGQVRWCGSIPGVIGSREQAEVNLLFFRSKAIPPLVVMVSGGKLAKGAREKLETILEKEMKGAQNFWKVLVLEAEPSAKGIGGAGGLPSQDKVKIEMQPLTEAIFKEALFREYAQDNQKEIGQCFRLPPMMRGDTEKLNRATAEVAWEVSDQQVFGPEKKDFEFDIQRTLLADLGIMLWLFKLNSAESKRPEQIVEAVKVLTENVITPNEARQIVGHNVFQKDLAPFDTDWAKLPTKYAIAGFEPESLEEPTTEQQPTEEAEGEKVLGASDEAIKRIRIQQGDFDSLFER